MDALIGLQVEQPFVDLHFPESAGAIDPLAHGQGVFCGGGLQRRNHLVGQEDLHLRRHAREEKEQLAPVAEQVAGHAAGAVQHLGALGKQAQLVEGNRVAQSAGRPAGGDAGPHPGVDHGLQAKGADHRLVGQVVGGRPQAAGDEDEISVGEGFPEGGADQFHIVADGVHGADLVAEQEQLMGRVAAGGVGDAAGGQFVADGDQFSYHVPLP